MARASRPWVCRKLRCARPLFADGSPAFPRHAAVAELSCSRGSACAKLTPPNPYSNMITPGAYSPMPIPHAQPVMSECRETYAANAQIAAEGSTGIGWYVLLSGRVAVFKSKLKIAEFGQRGTVFGEISSILKKPRTATLVALEPTEVIHINAELDELIAKHPDVARKIIVNLAERLAKTTGDLWTAVEKEDVK